MADDQMMNAAEVCRFLGGEAKPIDPSTLYRWIREGRFPKPKKIGNLSRWSRKACVAARAKMMTESAE